MHRKRRRPRPARVSRSPAAAAKSRRSPPRSAPRRFRFAPEVADKERQWILAAIDEARPEARQLIDDVDGMVTITTWRDRNDSAVGLMTAEQRRRVLP